MQVAFWVANGKKVSGVFNSFNLSLHSPGYDLEDKFCVGSCSGSVLSQGGTTWICLWGPPLALGHGIAMRFVASMLAFGAGDSTQPWMDRGRGCLFWRTNIPIDFLWLATPLFIAICLACSRQISKICSLSLSRSPSICNIHIYIYMRVWLYMHHYMCACALWRSEKSCIQNDCETLNWAAGLPDHIKNLEILLRSAGSLAAAWCDKKYRLRLPAVSWWPCGPIRH